MAPSAFVIELPIRERWQSVDLLRTAVIQCLSVVFDAEQFAEMVSMVVGELVENALKYGSWIGAAGGQGRLRLTGKGEWVDVAVSHQLREGADPKTLFSTLERIRTASSPQEAYVERLREVARDIQETGGLGLMRIVYETNCELTATFQGTLLTVRARMAHPSVGAGAPVGAAH